MVGGIIGRGLTLFDPTIEQLADVSAPTPNDGDVITYQASTGQWVAKAGGGGGISSLTGDVSASGTGVVSAVVVAIQNTQISAGTIGNNQVLTYNAGKGKWVPRAVAGSGTVTSVAVSALNGINVSGSPIIGAGTFTFKLGNITPTTVNTGIVSAASLNVTGDVLAATGRVTASAATLSAKLTGVTASFSGKVSADAGLNTTTLSAASIGITGDLNAGTGKVIASAGTFSSKLSADGGLNTTTISAASLNVTGDILAATGRVNASAATISGILSATNVVTPIVSIAFNGTTNADCSQGSYFRGVAVSAFTLSASNAYDGQKVIFEILQDSTGTRVMTPGASMKFGTDISAATLTTTASATDFVGGFFNKTRNLFFITAFVRGY